ncbi:hypothetical protein [Methanotorris igneus]|uniref:Uncharacterized protein n=1 Tax=Methanotorris igneus (strain DSM 5666 / JCM 11834 / Kol 5) TaxID=880724 RepID=F6BAQ6_METIK|nr:hypothetical protein [Methanotorris igneus]AEF95870.1 hypothetical protein Metig_0314 [Methanotorris igneus Kol 5]
MIVWNLICPNCKRRVTLKLDVCPCMASQIPIPKCENCNTEMTFDINAKRGRRRK